MERTARKTRSPYAAANRKSAHHSSHGETVIYRRTGSVNATTQRVPQQQPTASLSPELEEVADTVTKRIVPELKDQIAKAIEAIQRTPTLCSTPDTDLSESAEKNASNALYKYMCEHIVGSEEHVKTIRMMNAVRDNLQCRYDFTPITSGSFGEGLEMKGSDLDLMAVLKNVEICEDENMCNKPKKIYFMMQTEDIKPGYTQLRLQNRFDKHVLKKCKKIGSDYYLSNVLFTQKFIVHGFTTPHGPCISDVHGQMDMAHCFQSKSWITPAEQWITRSKSSWPLGKVKQSIVKHGVLFVPIGVKGSIKEELEWRISFSVGEKMLIFSFTHTQLICYALMKLLLKDVIASDRDVPPLLCSYFIKTVMFWISEEISTKIWKPENLTSCFMICFRRLLYYVKFSECPHYFIPSNNLFQNKIKGEVQKKLMKKLNYLNNHGWKCILFSKQISIFYPLPYGINKDPHFSHVRNVEVLSCSKIFEADKYIWKGDLNPKKGIHRLSFMKSSKIKSLYPYYISKLSYRSNQPLPCDDLTKNKSTYTHYKSSMSTLLLSTRHDAVNGWLLLASFFYRTKEYKKAIHLIQYCLLMCKREEKIYIGMTLSNTQKELINFQVFREMTSVQLIKFLLIGEVDVPAELVPDELRIEGEDCGRIIAPVVYANFLRFLCNYHLYSARQCRGCLRDLQLTIEKKQSIASSLQEAIAYTILGIAFQLVGKTESARQEFLRSIKLKPDKFNDAYDRLLSIG